MYIQPNTTIKLLKDVPLYNDYSDTLYFGSLSDQTAHFSTAYTSKTFGDQTYQRVNKNTIRLQVKADEIYNYNYLMFKNTAYSTKWFYAFITQIDYINDNVSEVHYEIDVMQTWFFDYQLEPCYVEREHSATDVIGENITPEPIDLGPIKCTNYLDTGLFDSYCAVVCAADNGDSLAGGTSGGGGHGF